MTYVDSSLHQVHHQNIHQHTSHNIGLLYLACISGKHQTSCHSCQEWRSQGCHYMGMAGTIHLVLEVVQNSLLHTYGKRHHQLGLLNNPLIRNISFCCLTNHRKQFDLLSSIS